MGQRGKKPTAPDMIGKRFERLVVVHLVERTTAGLYRWLCQCECGGTTTTNTANLRRGHTKSCGCLQRQQASRASRNPFGHSHSRLYRRWQMMIQRCHNPKRPDYPNYGGRGIFVADEWRTSFHCFAAAIGPMPSPDHQIERIDNDRNYEPGNVRWATRIEQARNRSTNTHLQIGGQTKTLVEWAEKAGVPYGTFMARLRKGWSPERAVSTPLQRRDHA